MCVVLSHILHCSELMCNKLFSVCAVSSRVPKQNVDDYSFFFLFHVYGNLLPGNHRLDPSFFPFSSFLAISFLPSSHPPFPASAPTSSACRISRTLYVPCHHAPGQARACILSHDAFPSRRLRIIHAGKHAAAFLKHGLRMVF